MDGAPHAGGHCGAVPGNRALCRRKSSPTGSVFVCPSVGDDLDAASDIAAFGTPHPNVVPLRARLRRNSLPSPCDEAKPNGSFRSRATTREVGLWPLRCAQEFGQRIPVNPSRRTMKTIAVTAMKKRSGSLTKRKKVIPTRTIGVRISRSSPS